MSISHEREYAVAIAFGIRTQGGAFVFPVDIEARLDDRERQILARMRASAGPRGVARGGRGARTGADAGRPAASDDGPS